MTKPCNLALLVCRGALGWLHGVKGTRLDKLSFQALIPSPKRQGVAVAFEYIQWLGQERNVSARTEGIVIRSLMQASCRCLVIMLVAPYVVELV